MRTFLLLLVLLALALFVSGCKGGGGEAAIESRPQSAAAINNNAPGAASAPGAPMAPGPGAMKRGRMPR